MASETSEQASLEVTADDVVRALPESEEKKWQRLSPKQQERTLEILSDPDFLTPAFDLSRNPEVKVSEDSDIATKSVEGEVSVQAVNTRRVWQNWTIAGIVYAEVTTSISYTSSGASVLSIQNCWTNVVNRVPLRTINWSNYSGLTGANAPSAWCKADLAIARPLQSTQYGTQGLLVNGYGTIVTKWLL